MFDSFKRLSLGIVLIAVASGILLYSDLRSRKGAQQRPNQTATAQKQFRVALIQHASQAALDDGTRGVLEALAARGYSDVTIREGLRRLGGNTNLYLRLLRDFSRAQATLPEQIQDFVDRGDLIAASHHAHSLKGAAANLAIPDVARSAAELETVLKDQTLLNYPANFAALKTALAVVLNSLNQLVLAAEPTESSTGTTPAPIMPETPESTLNRAAAREALVKLREQVAAGDLDATKELSNLKAVCGTHFRADLDALRQHLDAFNFEQANSVIDALETQLREG